MQFLGAQASVRVHGEIKDQIKFSEQINILERVLLMLMWRVGVSGTGCLTGRPVTAAVQIGDSWPEPNQGDGIGRNVIGTRYDSHAVMLFQSRHKL